MYRLLKDSHIKTVPALPDKLQAQDLLSALRSLRLDPHYHPAYAQQRNPSGLHNGTIVNMNDNVIAESIGCPSNDFHSPFDPDPTSPSQPSVISSGFHQSPRQDITSSMSPSNIATTAPESFSPVTYGPPPFEYPRSSQPKVVLSQARSQHLPPDHETTSPCLGLSSGFADQEPWHTPDSGGSHPLSPIEQHPLHRQRSRRASGESPSSRCFVFEHQREQLHRKDTPTHTSPWGWSTAGEMDAGLAFYGCHNNIATDAHDIRLGMDWESIEQRGATVVPPDSHAREVPGTWHGVPLN